MKHILFFILFISTSFFVNAQITPSEAAQALLSQDDMKALKTTDSNFAEGEVVDKEAKSIEDKYSKYNTAKKKKKWESKTKVAKKLRIEAQTERNKAYQAVVRIYSQLIEGGTYYFDEDQAMANENLAAAVKMAKKAERYLSKYTALSSSKFKKIAFNSVNNDIKKCQDAYSNAILGLDDALFVLMDQEEKKKNLDADKLAWENAQATNTIDAYKTYLNNHSLGQHLDEAQDKINELQASEPENPVATNTGITYKVQLLADRKQWSVARVAGLYPTIMMGSIVEWHDDADGFYKYATGEFSTYAEAFSQRNTLENTKEGVFVIAFQDDAQIDIIEARTATNELDEE